MISIFKDYNHYRDDGLMSDEDDMSWKVRRAAAKTLTTVVNNYPDCTSLLYRNMSAAVIKRFIEKEDSVRLDIFNIIVCLLKQTQLNSGSASMSISTAHLSPAHRKRKVNQKFVEISDVNER